jgi:hypothetical protein
MTLKQYLDDPKTIPSKTYSTKKKKKDLIKQLYETSLAQSKDFNKGLSKNIENRL